MFRQFIEHSNSSPYKAVIESVPSRLTLTCNTAQDLHLRSEYVHVIGAERFGKTFP